MKLIDKPGVAPIRSLLEDPSVTEIMINGPRQVYVERHGTMQEVPTMFTQPEQLDLLVDNLVVASGRGVNVRSPMVDFRMEDGSRVNICVAPVSLQGPAVTIRKFTHTVRTLADLVRHGTLTTRMAAFLSLVVRSRLNLVFSGGTGSGKTTTLGTGQRDREQRTARRHRGHGGTRSGSEALRAARGATVERGRGWRDHARGPAAQQPAHAAVADHRRRDSR